MVGSLGSGGTLTINNVDGGTTGGAKTVLLDYINGDVAFTNTACSNCRNAFISVNGGSAVQVQMPISAQVSSSIGNDYFSLLIAYLSHLFIELGYPVLGLSCVSFWIHTWQNEQNPNFEPQRICTRLLPRWVVGVVAPKTNLLAMYLLNLGCRQRYILGPRQNIPPNPVATLFLPAIVLAFIILFKRPSFSSI